MARFSDIDDYLDSLTPTVRDTAERLRVLLDRGLPATTGRIWHAQPVWMAGKAPVAGFKAHASYVTLMLWRGQAIDDPSRRLVPGSREMASAKFASPDDLDDSIVLDWLTQAAALEPTS